MLLTLEETIEQFKRNAEYELSHGNLQGFLEFIQLSKWLRELAESRRIIDEIEHLIFNNRSY